MSIASKQLIYNKDIRALQTAKEIIIPPGEPFSGSLRLKEMLRNVKGYAKIIDSYVDETTLEFLLEIPEDVPIRLLTEHTMAKKKKIHKNLPEVHNRETAISSKKMRAKADS